LRVDRRRFLGRTGAAALATVPLSQLFARPISADPIHRELIRIARDEVARAGGALRFRDVVGLADFSRHSSEPRFHVVNLHDGTVRSCFVAHGAGSDPENAGWLTHFSNMVRSNATSRGAFVTQGNLVGQHGQSVRLCGLDRDNSNALQRSLVLHSADYCGEEHLSRWGRLGRSKGSLALPPGEFRTVSQRLLEGRLVFADCLDVVQATRT
jgi:hypothetical protein